jgi:hypothetical protein
MRRFPAVAGKANGSARIAAPRLAGPVDDYREETLHQPEADCFTVIGP